MKPRETRKPVCSALCRVKRAAVTATLRPLPPGCLGLREGIIVATWSLAHHCCDDCCCSSYDDRIIGHITITIINIILNITAIIITSIIYIFI